MLRATDRTRATHARIGARRTGSIVPTAFGLVVLSAFALAGCNMGGRPEGSSPPPTVAAPTATPQAVGAGTYIVVGGDTVHAVANRFGVPIRSLIELNGLQPPFTLTPGQTLQIPDQRVHIVADGDTVSQIAQQYGIDSSTLVRLNDIPEPYTIYVGQSLVLPGPIEPVSVASAAPTVTAPITTAPGTSGTITSEELPPPEYPAATVPPPAASAEPTTTVAVPTPTGSTAGLEAPPVLLPGAATTTATATATAAPPLPKPSDDAASDAGTLASDTTTPTPANDPTAPAATTVPPTSTVPTAPTAATEPTATTVPPASTVPPAPTAPTEPTAPAATPSVPVETVPPADATADTAAEPAATQTASVDPMLIEPAARSSGTFLWPVTGKVVSEFGPLEDGLHNDGLNIAAPRGTPVRAAENGVVVYAGNELRGFGNMLLIRHADGFVTAYAHNESLLVARGDTVERGEIIARVGSTGNVDSPQVHFEIRVGTDAVDPREYLGSSGA